MANCTEEGCQVLVTGKCINNLPLDTCPHYSEEDDLEMPINSEEESGKNDETSEEITGKIEYEEVYKGSALTIDEANKIAAKGETRLIILAGMPDVGKTTLPLTLMDLFSKSDSIADNIFAGSKTLLEFEQKGHPSKIASERSIPETWRTPIDKPKFLHLKLAPFDKPAQHLDLLITDISGETFQVLKDNDEAAREFKIALRADHFALFFDADAITDNSKRANAKTNGIGILRSLKEAQVLLPQTNIQVIFSRWDYYKEREENKLQNDHYIAALKVAVKNVLSDEYNVEFHEVAARPKDLNKVPLGLGLKQVLKTWTDASQLENVRESISISIPADSREFLNFK